MGVGGPRPGPRGLSSGRRSRASLGLGRVRQCRVGRGLRWRVAPAGRIGYAGSLECGCREGAYPNPHRDPARRGREAAHRSYGRLDLEQPRGRDRLRHGGGDRGGYGAGRGHGDQRGQERRCAHRGRAPGRELPQRRVLRPQQPAQDGPLRAGQLPGPAAADRRLPARRGMDRRRQDRGELAVHRGEGRSVEPRVRRGQPELPARLDHRRSVAGADQRRQVRRAPAPGEVGPVRGGHAPDRRLGHQCRRSSGPLLGLTVPAGGLEGKTPPIRSWTAPAGRRRWWTSRGPPTLPGPASSTRAT